MPEKRKPLPSEAPRRDNKSRNRRNDQQAKPVPLASSTSKSPHPTPEAGSSNVQKNEAKFKEHNHDVAKPSNEPLFTTPSEIPQTPTNAKVTKRADEYLRSSPDKRLLEIDKAIYNFVIHCLNSQPSWNILSEETQAKLTNWAPKAKQYIEGDLLLRGALYLAWVWRVLYEHLFSAECTDKWSGEHWSNYGKLRSELGAHVAHRDGTYQHNYHSWRYLSTHMLSMLHNEHSDPNRLRRIIEAEFQEILIDPESQIFDQSIGELVDTALRNDFVFESNKLSVSMRLHDPESGKTSGFTYKGSSLMKEDTTAALPGHHQRIGQPVDFIRHPLVQFYGHPEGQDSLISPLTKQDSTTIWHCLYTIPLAVMVNRYPGKEDED